LLSQMDGKKMTRTRSGQGFLWAVKKYQSMK